MPLTFGARTEARMARKPAAAECVTMRSLNALNLATPGRWPESVARMDGPNGAPGFATGAPTRLAAPFARPSDFGAPWANVGALVALVREAPRAGNLQVSLERCRRGWRGPVAIASLAERGTLLRGARRPLMVGVSSNMYALRGNRTGIGLKGGSRRRGASYGSKTTASAGRDGGFQRSGSRSATLSSAVLSIRSRTSARYSTGFTPTRVQETTSE